MALMAERKCKHKHKSWEENSSQALLGCQDQLVQSPAAVIQASGTHPCLHVFISKVSFKMKDPHEELMRSSYSFIWHDRCVLRLDTTML